MSELDRVVGGLSCRQVLAHLSDYVDDDLAEGERSAVEAHLAGCDRCERFGGRFGAVVGALRRGMATGDPPPELTARLRRRLLEETPG